MQNDPVSVTVKQAAIAKAVRCDGVHPAVEIRIGLKQVRRIIDAIAPVLKEIGLVDAANAAEMFVKSVPSYMGQPEKIEIVTLAHAESMLPEVKNDLNALTQLVLKVSAKNL